ncbi:hypothetical protein Hanom_Chr07g00629481 [Helianthus anomalus]
MVRRRRERERETARRERERGGEERDGAEVTVRRSETWSGSLCLGPAVFVSLRRARPPPFCKV